MGARECLPLKFPLRGRFYSEAVPLNYRRNVPQQVTARQARLALLNAGLLEAVQAAVDGLPGAEGAAARIEWEYAQTVDRASPLVAALAAALQLDDEQLDALFTAASRL